MPPLSSHWQPTEFFAVFTRPAIWVSCWTVWSLTPPHSGNVGPCLASAAGVGADGTVLRLARVVVAGASDDQWHDDSGDGQRRGPLRFTGVHTRCFSQHAL